MKHRIFLLAVFALAIFAVGCKANCTALQSLDPAEAQHVEARGDNSIYGYAHLKGTSGEKTTCAGMPVTLIPASAYADKIMKTVYGSKKEGRSDKEADLGELDPLFDRFRRESICNRHGEFRFIDVPDGTYYVVALMNLDADAEEEGYKREASRQHVSRGDDYREHRESRYAAVQHGPGPVMSFGDKPTSLGSDQEYTPWASRQENPYRNGRRHEGTIMQRVSVEQGGTARFTLIR